MNEKWTPAKLAGLKGWYDPQDQGALIVKDGETVGVIDKATRRGRVRCWLRRHGLRLR